MLFKICRKSKHPLYSDLPGLFCPVRITGGALSFNNLAISVMRYKTTPFSRSFMPAVNRLWKDLPNHVVEYVQFQSFKCGANTFLLSRVFKCILVFIYFIFLFIVKKFFFSPFPYWTDFPVGAILVYSFMIFHLGFYSSLACNNHHQ